MLPLVNTRSHSPRPHPDAPTKVGESKKREVPLHIRMCLRDTLLTPYGALLDQLYHGVQSVHMDISGNRLDVPVHFHSSSGLRTWGFLKKVLVKRKRLDSFT